MNHLESTIRTATHFVVGFISAYGLACALSVLLWNWLAVLIALLLCWFFQDELLAIGNKAGDKAVYGAAWLLNKYRSVQGRVVASADEQAQAASAAAVAIAIGVALLAAGASLG